VIPRLVAGLGNDEKTYDLTPHNIGFLVLDDCVRRLGLSWKDEKSKVHATGQGDTRFIKPKGYMNVSGDSIAWASGWWRVPPGEILIVCDDFSLPWGKIRIRLQGRSGGHRGMDSVIERLNTDLVARLRVGVGPIPEAMDPKDYVLKKQSLDRMKELSSRGADALHAILLQGVNDAMNHYNGLPQL